MKKKIFVLCIIIAIIVAFSRVFADNLDDQKRSVQSQITQEYQNLEKISGEKSKVKEEVDNLNETITQIQSEISDLEVQIGKLNESIAAKQADLDEKEQLLDERLSGVYMNSGNTYLEALFTGGIFNFVSNYDMIKQIAEYDNTLIDEVKREKKELETAKKQLEKSKQEIEKKKTDCEDKVNERSQKIEQLDEEEKSIQSAIQEKFNELSRINAAVRQATQDYSDSSDDFLRGQGNVITDSNVPAASIGGMTWPTRIEHRVNSIYAPNGRVDTQGYIGTAHRGIDIYAPMGTPIYAAKDGVVVYVNYSGYGGGWGLYVVIYHGNDSEGRPVYTRYAHASQIAPGISVGTKVTTGSVIMYAGSTGASEGAHLHFEVCIGNMYNQVNPCLYLGITNTRGEHD